jgi:hypothetical protein
MRKEISEVGDATCRNRRTDSPRAIARLFVGAKVHDVYRIRSLGRPSDRLTRSGYLSGLHVSQSSDFIPTQAARLPLKKEKGSSCFNTHFFKDAKVFRSRRVDSGSASIRWLN